MRAKGQAGKNLLDKNPSVTKHTKSFFNHPLSGCRGMG